MFLVPDEARKEALVEVCGTQPAEAWPLYKVALFTDAVAALTGGAP